MKSEDQFRESILKVAEELKDQPLTGSEKALIIEKFNQGSGSAYIRSRKAIEEVINRRLPDDRLVEKSTASLNNIRLKLSQMAQAADNWEKEKGK